MPVAEGEPQPVLPRRAAEHREANPACSAAARATARLSFGSPSGNSSFACGISRSNCTGVGAAHRGGELRAGGEPDALLHRGQRIAVFGVDHRPRQRGVALRIEMAVIAALDAERHLDAERLQHVRRPRPERDHGILGIDRALVGIDAPLAVGAMQRARIALDEHAAERGKARRIGARHHQRIGERGDVRPHQRVAEHRREARLERERALGVERLRRDADLRAEFELRLHRLERRIAAVERHPAGLAQIFHRAGFLAAAPCARRPSGSSAGAA